MNTLKAGAVDAKPLTRTMQVHRVLEAGGQASLKDRKWHLYDAKGNEVPAGQRAIRTAVGGLQ